MPVIGYLGPGSSQHPRGFAHLGRSFHHGGSYEVHRVLAIEVAKSWCAIDEWVS